MFSTNTEDAIAEEQVALADSENCQSLTGKELAISSKGKTCLPSLVGVPCGDPKPHDDQKYENRSDSSKIRLDSITLKQITVDLSVMRAVNKWCRENGFELDPYWDDEFITTDHNLLPLNRMENMMSGSFIPPPIDLKVNNSVFTYNNGRHRHARILIQNLCNPRALLTRAVDYVVEKNPGPQPRSKPQDRKSKNLKPIGDGTDVASIKRLTLIEKNTQVYLRGRDLEYPDQVSLNRFNDWVWSLGGALDESAQRVCSKCGHVGFQLCFHSIAAEEAAEESLTKDFGGVVLAGERHHKWSFRPVSILKDGFHMPAFDTLSQKDENLNGFSNDHIRADLILPDLYNHLVANMQTSYVVDGREDRRLRLAHVHRLAGKWIVKKDLEAQLERDTHYNVCFRHTIQRACDNMSNDMLYEQRTPARNFGLAWLPKSRVAQLLFFIVGVMLVAYAVLTAISFLLSVADTAFPTLGIRPVFASTLPNGSVRGYQCVPTEAGWRLRDLDHVQYEIQYCEFSDWVIAAMNEVYFSTSEICTVAWRSIMEYRDESCLALNLHRIAGGFSPLQQTWDIQVIVMKIQFLLFRC